MASRPTINPNHIMYSECSGYLRTLAMSCEKRLINKINKVDVESKENKVNYAIDERVD